MQTVIVIGGGLAGISTAYELVSRGYRTTLYEAREAVARETSHANGGLLTPSMADPWNAPGVHKDLIASLFNAQSGLKLHRTAIPSLLGWGWRFLRHSTAARHAAATRASFLLAHYSVRQTRELTERLGLQYECAPNGSLKVFCRQGAMQGPLELAQRLAPLGLRFEVLSSREAIDTEPALADIGGRISGALRFPDDVSGNAHEFCEQLAAAFIRAGGRIEAATPVTAIKAEGGLVSGVYVGARVECASSVIVASGNFTDPLLRPHGVVLPIRPSKGYTVTFDASHVRGAPHVPVVDDALHAAIVPIGRRLRIAGTAEFAGHNLDIDPGRVDNLLKLFDTLMPSVARQLPREAARPWAGLRPMSADGLPFVGATRIRGLYVNAGHGHLGWTFAVGSARILCDLIEGKEPAIDAAPYRAQR